MAKNVLYKNSPIWCPELKKENINHIKTVIQFGTAYAIYKFSDKFQEFTLSRNEEDIIDTENYFSIKSVWFKKSKIPELLLDIRKENTAVVKNIISGNLSEKKIQELLDKSISEIDSY
jgi:hypothetical protein